MNRNVGLTDILFFVGIFLIPFDNIKFAPSAGWAAISPYFFLTAACLFLLSSPGKLAALISLIPTHVGLLASFIVVTSLISYAILPVYWPHLILTLFKLILGFAFLFCLFCMQKRNHRWIYRATKILFYGYLIALLFGILQFLYLKGFAPQIIPFDSIFSRYYQNKVQFSFTEPSFASVHVFGIISFFSLLAIREPSRKRNYLGYISPFFIAISVFSGSSLRVLMDCASVGTALFVSIPGRKKLLMLIIGSACIAAGLAYLPPQITERINRIITSEQILDPSAAIRKFRFDAAIDGVKSSSYTLLFGYGFGNSGAAMATGYTEAYKSVIAKYSEIEELETKPDGLTYSMHAKWIAEHGFIGYISIIILLFNRRYKFLWASTLIIYFQFDSYAFYTLWLYLYARIFALGSDQDLILMLSKRSNSRNRPLLPAHPISSNCSAFP
jgi:hypothetical protein